MISIIAAIGKNNELGKDNELIWHIKEDLANFKKLTMNKKIVMGKNTLNSLPKILDGREYIVLSSSLESNDYITVYNDFSKLLDYLKSLDEEVMIIGGSSIYKLFLPYADKLYLTEISLESTSADTYFPYFEKNNYNKKVIKEISGEINYSFVEYTKKDIKKGQLIIIEGTDCSGKETQTKRVVDKLIKEGKEVFRFCFPKYDTPTGKIIGGPLLGKEYICDGWFSETAPYVDPLVASAYYAADRRYNVDIIKEHLNKGEIVIIDRYVESNMAHQGGKLSTKEERMKMYNKLDDLEFNIMELPRPDAVIFLYMPYEYACILKQSRAEKLDQAESCRGHLEQAEKAYLELTDIYGFKQVDCVKNDTIRTIDDINEDVYKEIKKIIETK